MSSDALAALLAAEMAKQPSVNIDNPGYWFPLAVATYGVEEVLQAVDSMVTFRTSMWQKTREFEDRFGQAYGGEAVMVNSGSSADLLMVYANLEQSGGRLKAGDEVCLPAVTWPTHLWSVLMAGLKPVLVDVDPTTLNMSVADLKAKVTPRTGAIFPVHLMGNPADMNAILDVASATNALVLEDSCEALGARLGGKSVGALSDAGSFSFFFSHHITTMEGGMILTTNEELAERLRLLRAHGWSRNVRRPENVVTTVEFEESRLDPRYTFIEWGFNVRPTELQAGFGLEQFKRIPDFEEHRLANFETFRSLLTERSLNDVLSLPQTLPGASPSWFALPMIVHADAGFERDTLTDFLDANGVETRPIVAGNLARHPVRRRFPEVLTGSLPGADIVHERGFYVGLYPFDMSERLVRLADMMQAFVQSVTLGVRHS